MINWYSVFINSFWIIGLSLLLAAASYHYWLAQTVERPLRQQFNQPSFIKAFWASVGLVSIGLLGTSQHTWEMVIWGFFTLYCLFNLGMHLKQSPTSEQH